MTDTTTNGIPGELEARVDEIYAADLSAFIDRRKELVAELKASGDKTSAAAVQKLAKPNLIAWAINQLFFREREVFDSLVEAGEELRLAQQDGDAEDLRAAGDARREALASAVDKAAALLEQGGHAALLSTLQRLERSLETVAAYGHSGLLAPPVGRLIGDLDAPGFAVLATLAMAKPPASGLGSTKRSSTERPDKTGDKKKTTSRKSSSRTRVGSSLKKVAASEGGEESVSHPPKLSVLRGGGVSQPRSEKAATGSHRSVDAGHLRERNRLLRRARQLEILVGKSKTASVRSQRSLAETERAFDLRRRNLEAAQKAFEESQVEMEKRLARQAELEEQQRELTASLAEVRQELAALDPGGEEE